MHVILVSMEEFGGKRTCPIGQASFNFDLPEAEITCPGQGASGLCRRLVVLYGILIILLWEILFFAQTIPTDEKRQYTKEDYPFTAHGKLF